jgi:hypothetical protein
MRSGFFREYWANERFSERPDNLRLRVNDPGMSLHPTYWSRWESGENGQTTIPMKEDPTQLSGAELYLELWGGHPTVGPKGVSLNGHPVHAIPDQGTIDGHCEYTYPTIPIEVGELYNGRNSLQFSVGRGGSFWGHMIVDNAALVVGLKESHPKVALIDPAARGLAIAADPAGNEPDSLAFRLAVDRDFAGLVTRVDYFAKYSGYDENGSGAQPAWHGYTLNRRHTAHLGSSEVWPYRCVWDTSWIPDQAGPMEVAAVVTYVHGLRYRTEAVAAASPSRKRPVRLYVPSELPKPFWSRAEKKISCTIELDRDPGDIDRVQLHLRIWDGGAGGVKDHFTVNGHPYRVATGVDPHDLVYVVRDLDPRHLRRGANEIRLLSDTEHHGIEVVLPGPAFMVRMK